jgi:hypothetical protein
MRQSAEDHGRFTRQAVPLGVLPARSTEESLRFARDPGQGRLDLAARSDGGEIRLASLTAILVGHTPSPVGTGTRPEGARR